MLSEGEGGTKVNFCLARGGGGVRLNFEPYFAHFPTPPPPDNYCTVPHVIFITL